MPCGQRRVVLLPDRPVQKEPHLQSVRFPRGARRLTRKAGMRRLRDGDLSLHLLKGLASQHSFSVRTDSAFLPTVIVYSRLVSSKRYASLRHSPIVFHAPHAGAFESEARRWCMGTTALGTPLPLHQQRGTIERGERRHEAGSPLSQLTPNLTATLSNSDDKDERKSGV